MEHNFWQANFWGVVGTFTGVSGIVISWVNWRYSKPKIQIAEIKLIIYKTKSIEERFAKETIKSLENRTLDFKIYIRLRNKKGGSGSVEKPFLVIVLPSKKNSFLAFFSVRREIKIRPVTKHYESTRISSNTYSTQTINLGEAWNFNGGQTINDELDYRVRNANDLYDITQNYKNLVYYIEYSNNFGSLFKEKIKIIDENL